MNKEVIETNETVTVIIPCYNSEGTIYSSLKSLEKQTYKDFKVIIVNDGSTDHTIQEIDRYRQNSSMDIKVYSKPNGGVSSARNFALSICNTPWISFLDADDEYHTQFLETLISGLKNSGKDTIACRYEFVKKHGIPAKSINQVRKTDKTKYELLDIYTHHRIEKVNFGGFLYKKSILDEFSIRFPDDIRFGEDTLFICKYLRHCENGGIFVDETLYKYYVNDSSATHISTYDIVQNIEAQKRCAAYWKDDKGYDPAWGRYVVSRAVWAAEKTFAQYSKENFNKLQREINVKRAMEYMARYGDEKSIRISAKVYGISPILFYWLIQLYTKISK